MRLGKNILQLALTQNAALENIFSKPQNYFCKPHFFLFSSLFSRNNNKPLLHPIKSGQKRIAHDAINFRYAPL